jgi:hypothetical protein
MKDMLFRKLLPVLAAGAALSAPVAHAQFGVFATVTGERIGGVACQANTIANVGTCSSGTTTDKPYGSSFGGFYDFRSFGPVRVGAELRGSVLNTNKDPGANIASNDLIREYTVMGGVRASTGTPIRILRPFGNLLVGYSKFGPVYAYNKYTKLEGHVGVDIPIGQFFDIRAIELGAGALFGPSSHGTQSIGAGIVIHSPRLP